MASVTEPFRPAPPSLDGVRDPDRQDVYPTSLLEGLGSALVLFCARWYGRQDAYWIAEAGLTATCVDIDGPRLEGMRGIYPEGWEYVAGDAFQFVGDAAAGPYRWDVVSLDPFTNMFDWCADEIKLWCSVARSAVILGIGPNTVLKAPDGWRVSDVLKRSDYDGGVFWAVLEA